MEIQDIVSYLKNNILQFSKRQKMIAEYIIENYDQAAYMTAAELSEAAGVSESTVVRFAAELGFSGYQEMQKQLKQTTITQSTTLKRMEIAKRHLKEDDILSGVLKSDIRRIENTLSEIDKKQFDGAVNAILKAENIYITGVRSAAPLATFLDFYMHLIFDNTRLINSSDPADMFEQILRIGENDVIISMSFPRYSRNIIKVLEYANKKGATVVGITDSEKSPVAKLSDFTLKARSDMDYFADSLVAPFSVVNALIVALGMKHGNEITKTFEDLENIWAEYEVYAKE